MGQEGAQENDGVTLRYAQKVRTKVRTKSTYKSTHKSTHKKYVQKHAQKVRTKVRTSPRNTQRCVLKQGTFQMKGGSVLRTFSIDFYVQNVRTFSRKKCTHKIFT